MVRNVRYPLLGSCRSGKVCKVQARRIIDSDQRFVLMLFILLQILRHKAGSISKHPLKGRSIGSGLAGAVNSVTIGLAVDLAPIRVNCVRPGLVITEVS